MTSEPLFFASPAEFRQWLDENHRTAAELWVGFYKKATGRPSMTWSESVDEALCFGWIDGIRKTIDEESYVIRFTPRRPNSNWSNVNLRKMDELLAAGRVSEAGRAAFAARDAKKADAYSFEQRAEASLTPDQERTFRANPAAWSFFEAQPAGYRRTATWWVVSAKKESTRSRRLATLIADSEAGRRIALLHPGGKGT